MKYRLSFEMPDSWMDDPEYEDYNIESIHVPLQGEVIWISSKEIEVFEVFTIKTVERCFGEFDYIIKLSD